jgi:hypothetical protein
MFGELLSLILICGETVTLKLFEEELFYSRDLMFSLFSVKTHHIKKIKTQKGILMGLKLLQDCRR